MKKVIALFAVTVTTLPSTAPSWAMGPIFESLTSQGYPVTNKVDMALLLLVGDFGASCIF